MDETRPRWASSRAWRDTPRGWRRGFRTRSRAATLSRVRVTPCATMAAGDSSPRCASNHGLRPARDSLCSAAARPRRADPDPAAMLAPFA